MHFFPQFVRATPCTEGKIRKVKRDLNPAQISSLFKVGLGAFLERGKGEFTALYRLLAAKFLLKAIVMGRNNHAMVVVLLG